MFANLLRDIEDRNKAEDHAEFLIRVFKEDNERFDVQKFLKAAGLLSNRTEHDETPVESVEDNIPDALTITRNKLGEFAGKYSNRWDRYASYTTNRRNLAERAKKVISKRSN